ncbi:MAG: nucleotide exchange factor GrpE [Flavobacteriia bacterium]|nr:MAG: nucleotide exchange factor GrpE [Flavobacteriia bacterium]
MAKHKNKNTDKPLEDQVEETMQEKTEKEAVEVEEAPDMEALLASEKDKFLRLFAEFENYKKRTTKERLDLFKTANRELMSVLLPVLDDFERAMAEIKRAKDDSLFEGVELIYSKFKKTLEAKGLIVAEAKAGDTFDPEIHQAITQILAPSKKMKGKIIDVTEKGYKLGETFLRFPKVVVGQ